MDERTATEQLGTLETRDEMPKKIVYSGFLYRMKIAIFYILFYFVVICFFAAMMFIFYQTIDAQKPKLQLDESLIGSNPGLSIRPMPPGGNLDSSLPIIWVNTTDEGNVQYWQSELNAFLESYKEVNHSYSSNIESCAGKQEPEPGRVCDVALDRFWAPCLRRHGFYNSTTGRPCIFLKLNRIYGWKPDYYNNTDLPRNMPNHLQYALYGYKYGSRDHLHKYVWVTCEGVNPYDMENIGPIQIFPAGFSGRYFPFLNQPGYMSPLVAVYFEKPKRGVLINIVCKAWARNIQHDYVDRRGLVHFALMID